MSKVKIAVMLIFFLWFFVFSLISPAAAEETSGNPGPSHQLILNPYENVDWEEYGQYRANLHTHTQESDGSLTVAEVIDQYHARGYHVLSITDHDHQGSREPTWPWQKYGRNPDELGMVAIQGNELSYHHHMGSYFTGYYGGRSGSEDESLERIGEKGGLAIFFHPGRYHGTEDWHWYLPYFRQYPHLVGLEVYNMGDRYPQDRELWDNILSALMPDRPVWGFSNDDMHRIIHVGRNWNTFLLPELSEEEVRAAMEKGRFYFSYHFGEDELTPPRINEIKVEQGRITITADNYYGILWISDGEVVATGNTLRYAETDGVTSYVRARLTGAGGYTYTNPFGFYITATGIKFDQVAMALPADGKGYLIKTTVLPRGAVSPVVAWSSLNEDVATVEDGIVIPHTPGVAELTVTTEDGFEASSYLVVIPHMEDGNWLGNTAFLLTIFTIGVAIFVSWYLILKSKNGGLLH